MSKATLTFTDNVEKGTVEVELVFDPEVTDKTRSQAQLMAVNAITLLQQAEKKRHEGTLMVPKKEDL